MARDRGIVRPLLMAAVAVAGAVPAAAGELWDRARPWASAVALRGLVWLREARRG